MKPTHMVKYGTKPCATEVDFHNNSEALKIKEEIIEIECDYDETLDIKKENIQDQETKIVADRNFSTFESKVCSVDIREYILAGKMKERSEKNREIRNLDSENKYKCKKCARSYKQKSGLYNHQKFECYVTPQFTCNLCGKLFKRKSTMNRHVSHIHLNQKSNPSKVKYNCNNCTRSYNSYVALTRHKCEIHAELKRRFICDHCGYKTYQKNRLGPHIYRNHFK
ncbi:zinc finger protein 708-like [Belonocnema kinseyi]|uniref:zinc finger protein 708-like n=1 Tax=Belonocnema kinseyi TaxID=2817044 RepID=UPI00143CC8C4|nr:zinc finger protein 708-like [Belonocnema kinseyi]